MAGLRLFLSYARKDEERVEKLYHRLSAASFKPWMDKKNLLAGESWDRRIQKEIKASDYFLIILTKRSLDKRGYLRKEIRSALNVQSRKRNAKRYIIPVRLEKCKLPRRLSGLHCADIFTKNGWRNLLRALRQTASYPPSNGSTTVPQLERAARLPIGGLPTPCYFPSISCAAKNGLSSLEHLEVLRALKHPLFLISAYDIAKARRDQRLKINRVLDGATKRGQVVLLDAGTYEKRWLQDHRWSKKNYHETIRNTPCHLAFCYDDLFPKGVAREIAAKIAQGVLRDRRATSLTAIFPIVHSPKPADLPTICRQIADRDESGVIAIPERELGEGLLKSASAVLSIRRALNSTGRYYSMHILGAGNPWSLLVYAACGADSFDSLDWCTSVVDFKTARLYHSLHLDFFAHQSVVGSDPNISYLTRLLAHNLQFYDSWMRLIRRHISSGSLRGLMRKYLPRRSYSSLRRVIPRDV